VDRKGRHEVSGGVGLEADMRVTSSTDKSLQARGYSAEIIPRRATWGASVKRAGGSNERMKMAGITTRGLWAAERKTDSCRAPRLNVRTGPPRGERGPHKKSGEISEDAPYPYIETRRGNPQLGED